MLAHSLTKVWRVQVVESQSNSLNLLFFTALQDRRQHWPDTRQEAYCSIFRICLVRGSASATATARVLLSTLNTVPERHGAVPRSAKLLNSGRHGLQQHPSRAGGDARRARGGAAAGRRSGWDPADAVHRLAGSARHPRERRRGTRRRKLLAASTALGAASSRRPRKKAHRSAYIGTSPLRAPRKWTCGWAGERGLQSPTGWHLRTFQLDTKAVGRAISKSATGTSSAVIPGSRSDLWSDLTWPDIVMFICQSYVLKQFVGSQSFVSFTANSAK